MERFLYIINTYIIIIVIFVVKNRLLKLSKHIYSILVLSIFSLICLKVDAQKKIEIKYSGFLNFDEINYPGAKILTRDDAEQVHITHQGGNLWCDKAFYYGKQNALEAYGNVKLVQADTVKLSSKYIQYNGDSQLAFASGHVKLESPDSQILTDTLYFDRAKQEAFYNNKGTVKQDTTLTITSKIGRYYMTTKKMKFVNDVVLKNNEATVKSNYFDYYESEKQAYLYGPSTITTEESVTYCEKGFYDSNKKIGYAVKNAKINYDNREVTGDSLYFDNNKNFASATNNIKVTDTLNKSIITGHYAEVYKDKDSVYITKRALAITIQEKDSIYIHANKIMVTGKPEHRIARAYKNAKIYKTDLSGKADSIYSNQKTGLTKLININSGKSDAFSKAKKPILWNIDNQITGDTIHLKSNTTEEKIDSLIVFNNAFLVSKDTIGTGYNQIKGLKLVGLFNKENKLKHVDIIKNAQSIYYFRNDKDELIGIDKSKSGAIEIDIINNEVDEIKKINQVDGKIYPESKFPKIEALLKGFNWRIDERIKSVNDLFKDDPKFTLPKIKGLEDYIPQDDFFDKDLSKKIRNFENPNIASKKIIPIAVKEDNLLLSNTFKKHWYPNNIKIIDSKHFSPIGNNDSKDFIVSKKNKTNPYLTQRAKNTKSDYKSTYKFSVWLKGSGKMKIALQEAGDNYTVYKTSQFTLTNTWKEYSVVGKKENDNNDLRCVIFILEENKSTSAWGCKLTKSSN